MLTSSCLRGWREYDWCTEAVCLRRIGTCNAALADEPVSCGRASCYVEGMNVSRLNLRDDGLLLIAAIHTLLLVQASLSVSCRTDERPLVEAMLGGLLHLFATVASTSKDVLFRINPFISVEDMLGVLFGVLGRHTALVVADDAVVLIGIVAA